MPLYICQDLVVSTKPRENLNVNYGLQVKMMCHVDSSIVINIPLWWGILIMGEAIPVLGQGIHRTFIHHLLIFIVNLSMLF